ncbi:hypothetical protein JOD97_006448 [Duganella sp. 1411]|uniref:hypothetical protein n=1 Tax=Duganella sp. 1411 TaxID=2806572 RepID=UPI001AE20D1F|nr:hypothetical protein [Duganella sp. 1411]MBP1208356.1 hypothetical protein [Duganella sp. 1411]
MKRSLLLVILSGFIMSQAHAAGFKFNPIPLSDFEIAKQQKGAGRLKISISIDESAVVNELRVGGIVVCSVKACYRPNTMYKQNSANSSIGVAKLVVDSSITNDEITSVFFEELKGGNVSGSVVLESPLKIEDGYYGGEIFVTLGRKDLARPENYAPSYAVGNLLRENGNSIYYNPKFPMKINLDLGVAISIPENAVKHPAIFNAQITDTGERFPLVDIYPYVSLIKPISVTVKPIEKGKNVLLEKARVPLEGDAKKSISSKSQVTKDINKLGLLKSGFFETSQAEVSTLSDPIYTPCYTLLNQQNTTNNIQATALANHGIAYYTGCTNIPPYIHIVYVEIGRMQPPIYIPYFAETSTPFDQHDLSLRRITSLAPQDYSVAVNGFGWEGVEGTASGQNGWANGYVRSNGVDLGTNRNGGGVGNGTSNGNKYIMSFNSNYASQPITFVESSQVNYSPPGAVNVISTSTSVVKHDGATCSGDTLSSRWSVIGAGWRGGLVLISSTSDGVTSAAELCTVVNLLLMNGNALRLDGGPSAAMTINGVHVNPLTGVYSFKYGTARYIPYAIQIMAAQ